MYQWDEVRVGCEKTQRRQLREGGREKAGERLRSKGGFFFVVVVLARERV